jgi:hypothetical protein
MSEESSCRAVERCEGRRRESELRESSQTRELQPREASRAARRHRTCREFKAWGGERMKGEQNKSSVQNRI